MFEADSKTTSQLQFCAILKKGGVVGGSTLYFETWRGGVHDGLK